MLLPIYGHLQLCIMHTVTRLTDSFPVVIHVAFQLLTSFLEHLFLATKEVMKCSTWKLSVYPPSGELSYMVILKADFLASSGNDSDSVSAPDVLIGFC